MKAIKKAIIPVAGLGTRFLPITKTIPKEMLPIVDKPNLLYIIEEAVSAGIEDIILIQGRNKNSIEDFFDVSYELEDQLVKKNKHDLLNKIKDLKNMCNIISIRQKQALGLGHAVFCAQPIIGDNPFALLLGDEIMYTDENTPTVTKQLITHSLDHNVSTVATMHVPAEDVYKYGIIKTDELSKTRFKVLDVVEKPNPEDSPSDLALPGRYVFESDIFSYLKNTKPGKNGEIQLTDAMVTLAKNNGLEAITFKGLRYDAGDKFGFLQANIEFALRHPEIKEQLKKYLIKKSKELI